MNLVTVRNLGTTLALVAALSGCKGSEAPDATTAAPSPSVEATPASAPATETTMAAEEEAAPLAIPDTADGIWQAIEQHSAELKATIANGPLSEVHLHAFAIRDLVAGLPARSPTLPAEDQAKLEGEVKFVATLATRLDETGDAGDQAGSQANYDKLVTVLNGITRNK